MLSTDFTIIEKTRANIKKIITSCSLEELNTIPAGFNNNLIWNFGHVTITQQLLCYGLSNTEMYVKNELVTKYRKGSQPDPKTPITQEEYDLLMSLFEKTPILMKNDYEGKRFGDYKEYTTSYGMTLSSVEDAIRFNNVHESMHLGACILLKKFV